MAQIQSARSSNRPRPSLVASERSLAEATRVLEKNYSTALRFEYSPLKSQTKEIRLLKLPLVLSSDTFPTATECLMFELHHASLLDAPPYYALSYHWGDPTLSHRVICNGRQQSVSKSLAQALYTIVSYFTERAGDISDAGCAYIWADALCINQQDIGEKTLQIPMMGDIYSRASRVIGYVGCPRSGNPWDAVLGIISLGNAQDLSSVCGGDCEPFPDAPDSVAQGLVEFCSSPWFSRSWVTQEVVLASDVLCLYGLGPTVAYCALNILTTLIMRVGSMEDHRTDFARFIPRDGSATRMTISQIERWEAIKQKRGTSCQGLDLVTVLRNTWGTEVTDTRDKVFSIMGLLDDRSRGAIRVDYSGYTSTQQIYTEVAKYCINTQHAIRLLEHAGLTDHLPDLPTWVPDWSRKSCNLLRPTLYKAAGSTVPTVSLLEDGSKISVRGVAFDPVTSLSPAVAYPDGTISGVFASLAPVATVVLDVFARHFYTRSQPMQTLYPTRESLDEAILKTLIADRSWAGRRCTAEDWRYFHAWQAKYGPSGSKDLEADLTDEELPVEVMSKHTLPGRRLCVTRTGFLGLVPESTKVGDVVAIFFGAELPFVVRHVRNSAEFELVGHCYIHGAMDGEVLQSDRFVTDFRIR